MKTEKEKMLNSELYNAQDEELKALRAETRGLLREYNSSPCENTVREKLLEKLLGYKTNAYIEAPFYCDYGTNIKLGQNVYMNFGCTILDCTKITIGDNTLLGPNVQLYGATHPIDAQTRLSGLEFGKEIHIGKNCWLGGNCVILPGVKIGDNSIVGAGAVVTKDVPENSIALGNPAKITKK